MYKYRIRSCVIAIVLLGFVTLARAAGDDFSPFPAELEADLSAGTSAIYLLDFKTADRRFRNAIGINPDHPAAYFFRMMLTWYRLTYDSLLNRDRTLEKLLEKQAEWTIKRAKKFSKKPGMRAVGYLYWGGALGAKGWYHVTRGQWIRAYFSGKKGYSYIRKVLKEDPKIYDAYMGIGMYEYYAATLGPTLRVLASFHVRGSREQAIRSLNLAVSKGRYVRLEAAYFLWDAAREEGRLDDAHAKIKVLLENFPNSPLFRVSEIQTLYSLKEWKKVLERTRVFVALSRRGPQLEGRTDPFNLLLSKVYYHAGMAATRMGDLNLAEAHFEMAIRSKSVFEGWKALACLRQGELYDLEDKRGNALEKYRAVFKYPNVWDCRKVARKRIRKPYKPRKN